VLTELAQNNEKNKSTSGKVNKSLESSPIRIQSAMVVPRPAVISEENYGVSTEVLSKNLQESVKMIKDLMDSNRKLKDTINELSINRKTQDAEIAQLQAENQFLLEKIEGGEPEKLAILILQQENEVLGKRLQEMENEAKKTQPLSPVRERKANLSNEWSWRSKRTILRGPVMPLEEKESRKRHQSVRPNTRVQIDEISERQEVYYDSPQGKEKDFALSTQTVMHNRPRANRYGKYF
jgi:hypothetical protein